MKTIRVTVVTTAEGTARTMDIELPQGATVANALRACGLLPLAPGEAAGIFGEITDPERRLAGGERVEVYRPLIVDPKESRRSRVQARRSQTGRKPGLQQGRSRG